MKKSTSHVTSRCKRNSRPESKLSNLPQMFIYGPSGSKVNCYSAKMWPESKEKVRKLEKMQISFHSGFSCIRIYTMLYTCKHILAHRIALEILFRSSLPSLMEKTQKMKFSRLTCISPLSRYATGSLHSAAETLAWAQPGSF